MNPKQENDRKRGAQAGNHNAFKHGFYSDQFKKAENAILRQMQNMDLTGEIQLMRIQLRRYLEAESLELKDIDYETRLQALRTVSLAADSLARLIRMQEILNSNSSAQANKMEGLQPLDDTENKVKWFQ